VDVFESKVMQKGGCSNFKVAFCKHSFPKIG